jgi:pSer/pThr/pTyr-binding forkhead associated (FHA) protein
MVHVLSCSEDKDTFRMGRGHESDIRVNDISVSRCHAIVKYREGAFFVEDNLSKFGTLVHMKDRIEIEQNFTKAL